ncbi:MAG TPA: hypothetical protein DIT04_14145 [Dysgonomonas sp.]|nr:hypothetical protein [Dysgonomonas sp.]
MEDELIIHQGKGVKHFREFERMSIEELAKKIGITPERLQQLEEEPTWEEGILQKAARELHAPYILISQFYPEIMERKRPITIYNNTFNDESAMKSEGPGSPVGSTVNGDINITTMDKIVDLYDSTIKELKQTIARLESEIDQLKKK